MSYVKYCYSPQNNFTVRKYQIHIFNLIIIWISCVRKSNLPLLYVQLGWLYYNAWGWSHEVRGVRTSIKDASINCRVFFVFRGPNVLLNWLVVLPALWSQCEFEKLTFFVKIDRSFFYCLVFTVHILNWYNLLFNLMYQRAMKKWKVDGDNGEIFVCSENFWGTILIRLMVNPVSALRITICFWSSFDIWVLILLKFLSFEYYY